jgi:hypothetical protein
MGQVKTRIDLNAIASVRLVTAKDPAVVAFLERVRRQSAMRTEAKRQERAEERAHVERLFDRPFRTLLDEPALLAAYQERIHQPRRAARTCLDCQRCGSDRERPGRYICWRPSRPTRRPLPLDALTPCAEFVPRDWRTPSDAMTAWLHEEGIAYSTARWEAHRHDLARHGGGVLPFARGQRWERVFRGWITMRHGPGLFLPHRWLVAREHSGIERFREVDGIERVSPTEAIVYEIKVSWDAFAYETLTAEYLPLLRLAFPHVRFVALEINRDAPHPLWTSDPWWRARSIVLLPSFEARSMAHPYQLWIPPPTVAEELPLPATPRPRGAWGPFHTA